MSSRKNLLNVTSQAIVILAILFSSFAPTINVVAQTAKSDASSTINEDISTGITIGSNTPSVNIKVPILSEEIAKQAQNQSDETLHIKLSAEPAIYIPGKPIVITWKIVGGKASGLQIIVHPSNGIVPASSKIIPETDGSVIISPKLDSGSIGWNVLSYAEFPLSFVFDVVVDGKVVSTNSELVDQSMITTSTNQTTKVQSNEQGNKNKTEVTIPANAASAAMLMAVRYPSPNALNSASLSWNPVEVIAVDKNTAKNITKFKNPITIQITYDENNLFGAAENDLSIFYYDPDLQDWFPIDTQVDSVNNTLTVQSNHLTVFDYKANTWQSQMLPTVDAFKTSDFTGAATYDINMWTPPAPGGLQPSVSLGYNSQIIDDSSAYSQASWAGMGWDLQTGSVTLNMHGTGSDTADDTFNISIGGSSMTLLLISRNGNIAQYNTADQAFMKVESHDFDISGADPFSYSFIAWTKDGTRYDFKETIDVRKNSTNCNTITWRWSLSKVTDVHGNFLTYHYYTEPKNDGCTFSEIAVYPQTITYGNPLTAKYQIYFDREARTDYQTSWTSASSYILYGTSRLKEVQVQQKVSGSWVNIRRYALSYAPNNTTNIYPNFSFNAGGKILTLVGIQEFGSDGTALPAVQFTYGDSMHLTRVNNGQGGLVDMAYTDWQYRDDVNKDIRTVATIFMTQDCINGPGASPTWTKLGSNGTVRCDATKLLQVGENPANASVAERVIPQSMIKPSARYNFKVDVRAVTGTANVTWGISNGAQTTMLSATGVTTSGGVQTAQLLTMPVTYNPAAVKLRLTCAICFFRSFEFAQYVVLYRVASRTVTTQPNGVVSTNTYQYDNASPATVDNSAAVATTGGTLYTQKLREFRGNAMSQVTNPEGLTTVNWFWQADGLKGRGYDTLLLKRDAFDAMETLGTGWVRSGGTHTAAAIAQKDFDNSTKSVNAAANWAVSVVRTTAIADNKVAVAHIRLSGASAQGQVGLQGGPVILLASGTATVGGSTLLTSGNFKLDEWYGVMFFTDAVHGDRVRIWQLDNPNNFGEAVVGSTAGKFFTSVYNGTIYTDSYFEGTPYSESITRYGSAVQYSHPTYVDLKSVWVFVNSVENRNYNGDAAFVGTKQDFTYATAAQFGNLLSRVESGNDGTGWAAYRKTNYEYYPVVSPPTTPTTYLVSTPARQTITMTDVNNTLLAETLYFYDGNTSYTASPTKGDLTTQRVWAGGSNYAQTSMTYDGYGNIRTQSVYTEFGTATTSPVASSKQTTTTDYDIDGYNTYPIRVTNQMGQHVDTVYNYALGLPISVTNANGAATTTSATYDGFGRMKTITAPGDSLPTLQVNYFDASIPFKIDLIQTISATSNIRLSRFYDGAGRQIQTQTASAVVDGSLQNIVVDYQYNNVGRMVKQTVPYVIANNATPAFNAPTFTQSSTSTTYDVIGRALTTTAPNNTSVIYTYSDLGTTVKDPKQNLTATTTDVWGRTTLVDAPTGPDISYGYDVLNHLKTATRAGATTTINYDVLGRKLNMDDPDMGYWQYGYDALGNLKTQTDAKGQITCLYYDALNRLDGKIYSNTGSCTTPVNFDVDFIYDVGTNGIGRRTSMMDASGSTAWTYDTRGRLSTETKSITGASPFVTSWNYNTGDLPVSMTYPDSETLTYGYNSDGTLKTVTSSLGDTYLNDMRYDEAGRLKLIQYGNNVINKTFNYFAWNTTDMGGLLSSVSATGLSSLQNLAYTYDKNGNVLTITDALAGPQTQNFSYDELNRIKTASATGGTNGLYSESYDYDSASGNLSLKNGSTYIYNDIEHIHAATSLSNGNSYSYDPNGNMITRNVSGQAFSLVYDEENRLTSVTTDGGSMMNSFAAPNLEAPSVEASTPTPTETAASTPISSPVGAESPLSTETSNPTAVSTETPMPTASQTETATATPEEPVSLAPAGEESSAIDPLAAPTTTETPIATATASEIITETAVPTSTDTPIATPSETPIPSPTATSTTTPQAESPDFTADLGQAFAPLLAGGVFSQAGFTYDGDGLRVKSVMTTDVATTTTYFVGNHYELTAGIVTKYYYAGSQRIAMRKNGTLNYLIGDHLGSTSLVTDASGNVVNQTQYKAWGEERYSSGTKQTGYGYTGQYSYAADFGLHFYNARWYDSSLGRFAQADTIVPAGVQGYDRYAYVNNNPVRYTDPTGHCFADGHWVPGVGGSGNCPGSSSGNPTPTPTPTPTPAPAVPQAIIYFPGFNVGANGGPSNDGPTWQQQMSQDIWDMSANPLGLPTATSQYIAKNKKQGQADAAPSPSQPVACIGMSAGADSCVLYAIDRLNKGLLTTNLVLIGGTFETELRPQFSDWTVDLKRLLDAGTKILLINDASIFSSDGQQPHETFSYTGYKLGQVPLTGNLSVLPHHLQGCNCNLAASNSQDLANSAYNWISTGQWSWPYP